MAHEGGYAEEWELEATDNMDPAFENNEEGEQWIGGNQADYGSDDHTSSAIRSAPHNWRQKRDMSPLEGAQHEMEMDDRREDSLAENSGVSAAGAPSRDTMIGDHHQSGGDKFHVMEDGSDDGQAYFYDEDLTRTRDNPNAEARERTRSDTDLIFRGPSAVGRTFKDDIVRYTVVAMVAFGLGILLGVLINMATTSCTTASSNSTTFT